MQKKLTGLLILFLLLNAACNEMAKETESKAMSVYKTLVMIFSDPDAILRKEIVGTWDAVETPKGETVVFESSGKYHGYDGRESYKGTWQIEKQRLILSLGGNYSLRIHADSLFMDEDTFVRKTEMLSLKK